MNIANEIDFTGFSTKSFNLSKVNEAIEWMPKNNNFSLPIAEEGVIITLEAMNSIQDLILVTDQWIGYLESEKSKAWRTAALEKASAAGYKAVKQREWFAQADEGFIEASNAVIRAKAMKTWLTSKADYFLAYHRSFRAFLKRDYGIERLSNVSYGSEVYDHLGAGDKKIQNKKFEKSSSGTGGRKSEKSTDWGLSDPFG